jgi:hypothetical protein
MGEDKLPASRDGQFERRWQAITVMHQHVGTAQPWFPGCTASAAKDREESVENLYIPNPGCVTCSRKLV